MDNKKTIEDYSKEECKQWLQSLVLTVSENMNELQIRIKAYSKIEIETMSSVAVLVLF